MSIREVIYNTYKNEGLLGFYRGLKIDLVRVLPTNTITFLTYEFAHKKYKN